MKKVLIANRGEIAVRIIRACHDLGLQTVAIYSKADTEALHVLYADEAICIGDVSAKDSYLKAAHILSACEISGADAIHPGYGFHSENSDFASICERCGIVFIGPSSQAISLLGDKSEAKKIAKSVGCSVIPGSEGVVETIEKAKEEAKRLGFPLMIKAVSGGGGKGIRVVSNQKELEEQFSLARIEGEANFGNPEVYLEKVILHPRHIEIQVLGDKKGNVLQLGERDCSVQRRRQKLIEETPSRAIDSSLRKAMGEAAVNLAKKADYYSAGTVEFLLDGEKNFYFMEMNARIQVEHTVTESITGVDLVREQLRVAMGNPLNFTQKDIILKGASMQFRINAEDPTHNFAPSPGKLEYFVPPGGPHVRIDTACYSGYVIPPYYDSMIAKLIVTENSREEVIATARRALREFHIGGVKTTIPFHQRILENTEFCAGNYDLNFVEQFLAEAPHST